MIQFKQEEFYISIGVCFFCSIFYKVRYKTVAKNALYCLEEYLIIFVKKKGIGLCKKVIKKIIVSVCVIVISFSSTLTINAYDNNQNDINDAEIIENVSTEESQEELLDSDVEIISENDNSEEIVFDNETVNENTDIAPLKQDDNAIEEESVDAVVEADKLQESAIDTNRPLFTASPSSISNLSSSNDNGEFSTFVHGSEGYSNKYSYNSYMKYEVDTYSILKTIKTLVLLKARVILTLQNKPFI